MKSCELTIEGSGFISTINRRMRMRNNNYRRLLHHELRIGTFPIEIYNYHYFDNLIPKGLHVV